MTPEEAVRNPTWTLVFACWLLACVSTLGSLFFSEVMGIAPCILCWYQRICMYPLVLILPVGLIRADRNVAPYALPLSLLGALVALFHLLLMAGYIPESIKPCVQGIPCTEAHIQWFGFVTIPMLSTLSFVLISALLILAHRRVSRSQAFA